ncbi:hypothetical protein ACFTAO_41605 [Paenibacillus rhizoplanae]
MIRAGDGEGSLLFQGVTSGTRRVVPAWNTGWIKPVQTRESVAPSYLFYGQEKHHLVHALTGEALEIPVFLLRRRMPTVMTTVTMRCILTASMRTSLI